MNEEIMKSRQIITAQKQQINELSAEIADQKGQINYLNQELKLKNQEISRIYNSQTYRFIVKPIIWPLISFIKGMRDFFNKIYDKLLSMRFSFEKKDIYISRFYADSIEAVYKGNNEYFFRLGNRNFEEKKIRVFIDIWPYTNRSHPKRHFCYCDMQVSVKPMSALDIKVSYDWEAEAKFFLNSQEGVFNIWRGCMTDAELYTVELIVYDLKNHILDRVGILQRLKK